jgi:hypothetical protein
MRECGHHTGNAYRAQRGKEEISGRHFHGACFWRRASCSIDARLVRLKSRTSSECSRSAALSSSNTSCSCSGSIVPTALSHSSRMRVSKSAGTSSKIRDGGTSFDTEHAVGHAYCASGRGGSQIQQVPYRTEHLSSGILDSNIVFPILTASETCRAWERGFFDLKTILKALISNSLYRNRATQSERRPHRPDFESSPRRSSPW